MVLLHSMLAACTQLLTTPTFLSGLETSGRTLMKGLSMSKILTAGGGVEGGRKEGREIEGERGMDGG